MCPFFFSAQMLHTYIRIHKGKKYTILNSNENEKIKFAIERLVGENRKMILKKLFLYSQYAERVLHFYSYIESNHTLLIKEVQRDSLRLDTVV